MLLAASILSLTRSIPLGSLRSRAHQVSLESSLRIGNFAWSSVWASHGTDLEDLQVDARLHNTLQAIVHKGLVFGVVSVVVVVVVVRGC